MLEITFRGSRAREQFAPIISQIGIDSSWSEMFEASAARCDHFSNIKWNGISFLSIGRPSCVYVFGNWMVLPPQIELTRRPSTAHDLSRLSYDIVWTLICVRIPGAPKFFQTCLSIKQADDIKYQVLHKQLVPDQDCLRSISVLSRCSLTHHRRLTEKMKFRLNKIIMTLVQYSPFGCL